MASTFTPNIQIEEPARGDDVGTWDTPVNSNMTLIDKVVGAITTISLNNSPVVLSAAQFQSKQITFNSTLTGSVAITFPSTFTKSYEIQNLCSGSSAFVITLGTTVAGGQAICCPPGETIDCFNDGTNLKFKNFGRVGTYEKYACSSAPLWVTGCTVPPLLTCDGTAFSSATYPALAVFLGRTTTPDMRGSAEYMVNQGTGRLTTASGGLDGNTLFSAKTTPVTLGTSNLPAYTPGGGIANGAISATVSGSPAFGGTAALAVTTPGAANVVALAGAISFAQAGSNFTGTAQGGVSNAVPVGTGLVYGISMIRAA